MLVRLTLCAALLAALGGCASYDSRYYRDDVVYEDGSYYAPAADGEGDYYYAPDDDAYGYDNWNDWGYGPGYPPYFLAGPGYGVAGFNGYCSVAYPACLPWWTGSYIDPRYRYWFGIGWGTGWSPYRRHDRGWDGDHDRWRHEHGSGHDHDQSTPTPAPPPAPDARPTPDPGRPLPGERMPRPVFEGKFPDRELRPDPPGLRRRPASPPLDTPSPSVDDVLPAPTPRWRERRTMPVPAMPAPADSGVRLRYPPAVAPRPVPPPSESEPAWPRPSARREPAPAGFTPVPRAQPAPASRDADERAMPPSEYRPGRRKTDRPPQ